VLVEGGGNGAVDVDALESLLVALLHPLPEGRYALLQLLLVVLPLLAEEQLVQLETAPAVAQRVVLDVFQELGRELVLTAELEEVLNAVEPLVVVEHEEVLVLLLLRHVAQPVQGVEGAQQPLRRTLHRTVEGGVADQRDGLVGGEGLLEALPEYILLALVENAILFLHGGSNTRNRISND
jgi:hypothetical protein